MVKSPSKVRIRVDLAPGVSIGPGKIALLEAIEREGSLSMAARSLKMSYRRAWMLLDDLNRSFKVPVVTTVVGGLRGGGARLTQFGLALVQSYRALERDAARAAGKHLKAFGPSKKSAAAPVRHPRLATRLGR
jgi:molybdate transport system regulatory protein